MDLTTVAHDLRTPLHIMLVHMQLLADERLSPPARRRLDIVETQIRRMVRLLESATAPPSHPAGMTPVDLSVMIRDVVDELGVILALQEIDVAVCVDTFLPPVVGDRDALHRVLVNVLVNAADSMTGGGHIGICARCAQLPSVPVPAVQIEITDSGAGIPSELIPHVFEQGFSTKQAGRGLGLGICREIVERHGGHMGLASEQGKGTTVRLSLPTGD
jgi:signal transduction histidine kinase